MSPQDKLQISSPDGKSGILSLTKSILPKTNSHLAGEGFALRTPNWGIIQPAVNGFPFASGHLCASGLDNQSSIDYII